MQLNLDCELEETSNVPKCPRYNPIEIKANYPWNKGVEFTSIEQFKQTMREYCLLNEHNVTFKPNYSTRCRAKCKSERCHFMTFVNKVKGSKTFSMKTLCLKHTHVKTFNGHLTSFD